MNRKPAIIHKTFKKSARKKMRKCKRQLRRFGGRGQKIVAKDKRTDENIDIGKIENTCAKIADSNT
jgi:hypothetical protein